MRINRRRALKGLSASALATAGCVGRKKEPDPTLLELARAKVKTLVVVMMENRSFDHVFGALSLVEGRTDVDGLRADIANPDGAGNLVKAQEADLGCIEDPPHGWDSSHAQFNGGACDGFVTEYAPRAGAESSYRVMDYLPREKQTASFALAEEYALCQRYFCSVMGPTWPNRFYLVAANAHGRQSNDFITEPIDTVYSRMDRAKVKWANYYGNIHFSVVLDISSSFPEVEDHDAFFAAAEAGTLPSVVIIDPVYGKSDDHPPAHPVSGQLFLQSIYDALKNSPQWEECMLVVTYDEHGGFHDHVPPPLTVDDRAAEGFDQLGFRVPAYAVGPWVKKHVSDVVFDHSSFYATVAALHDLEPLQSRDAEANTFLELLDVDRMRENAPRAAIELAPIVADEAEIFAPECDGFSFLHTDGTERVAVTGQVELERALAIKEPQRFELLRATTDEAWKKIVERAKARGLLKLS